MEEYQIIGKRVPRIDGKEKVMGQAKYAADYSLPDMLWCKTARSPFPPRADPQYRHKPGGKTAGREGGGHGEGLRRMDMGVHGDDP